MEFRWANNFLFFKNSLVTFISCLSSDSFAIKVKCFVLQHHFINFALIEFWCFVRGVLLIRYWSMTNVYDIFRLMLLIFCSWKSYHLGFACFSASVFSSFKLSFLSNTVNTAQYRMTLTFHKSVVILLLLMNYKNNQMHTIWWVFWIPSSSEW